MYLFPFPSFPVVEDSLKGRLLCHLHRSEWLVNRGYTETLSPSFFFSKETRKQGGYVTDSDGNSNLTIPNTNALQVLKLTVVSWNQLTIFDAMNLRPVGIGVATQTPNILPIPMTQIINLLHSCLCFFMCPFSLSSLWSPISSSSTTYLGCALDIRQQSKSPSAIYNFKHGVLDSWTSACVVARFSPW